jgi:hypothetical protein
VSAAACVLVVFGAASASAAKPVLSGGQAMASGQSAAATAGLSWGNGVEASLPANAATTGQEAFVNSVSCSSVGNCSAVGSYYDDSGPPNGNEQGLLLTETGGSWGTGVEAVLPANANPTSPEAGLYSVSCASAGNCSAIGGYVDSLGYHQGLLLTETAGIWSAGVEASLPGNAVSRQWVELGSVSCASAGNCTAVGSYFDGPGDTQGLLLTETAGSWATGLEATLPANAATTLDLAQLNSVSCPSAGNCTAVGNYYDSSQASQGLLVSETAGSWAAGVEASLPANASTAQFSSLTGLESVSCSSAGNCSAVGQYNAGSAAYEIEGLMLTETGDSWATGVEAALPANATMPNPEVELHSVSCPSAGNCSAVGRYYDSSDAQGLLLSETAGSWATGVEALPANAAATAQSGIPPALGLLSVSCASAGNCAAVGSHYTSNGNLLGVLLTEEGGNWATGTVASLPPNSGLFSEFLSVSCPSAGNCAAGGYYGASSGREGLLTGDSPPMVRLDISKNGTGSGTVSSVPVGIDCGPTCSASLDAGSLTLTATPSPGSRFSGWSGGGCSGTNSCQTDIVNDQVVTATFTAVVKLDISKNGTGSGSVSSDPPGISCGTACSGSFDSGSSLKLFAIPRPGSRFSGWSGGGCSGTGTCQMNDLVSDQAVTAAFTLLPSCVVPKLQDKPLQAAKHAITTHNCAVGRIKHGTSPTTKRGHVISQTPKPGRRLHHGARVNLVVSKGRR